MSRCKGIIFSSLYQAIIDDFTELKELNLFDTDLSIQSVDYLVNNITTKIEKLSLRSLYFVRDRHVKTLVKRFSVMSSICVCFKSYVSPIFLIRSLLSSSIPNISKLLRGNEILGDIGKRLVDE